MKQGWFAFKFYRPVSALLAAQVSTVRLHMDVVKKYCIGFAIFHVVVFVGFILFMKTQGGVAQHQLYWFYWLIIDFPVSLLVVFVFWLDASSYQFLCFAHGVLGTAWWYCLPRVFLAIDPRSRK